jgi:hypothetical protein
MNATALKSSPENITPPVHLEFIQTSSPIRNQPLPRKSSNPTARSSSIITRWIGKNTGSSLKRTRNGWLFSKAD